MTEAKENILNHILDEIKYFTDEKDDKMVDQLKAVLELIKPFLN